MQSSTRRILIGVHVTSAHTATETLLALHETTAHAFELIVLVDPAPGEAQPLAQALASCNVARLAVPGPGGAAVSFNELVAHPADIYVFLEDGARPGPDWLERLLRALDADPGNGLAGPSTNRCWNEQAVAAECGDSAHDVEREAESLVQRFGESWRSMAPLHSLSDFCLAVRKEVVAAIGAADASYGRGPCWEMDYGVRAARAGFRGVWVQAAFVRRGPITSWRIADELALFEVNKRLYQDRFCGRRAGPGGDDAPYHAHCHGDACPDFAPASTTRVRLPLRAAPGAAGERCALPLVSCIMPTRGRPEFVARSIAYFRRQAYPNRELIIVHEDDADLPGAIEGPDVRAVRTTQRSIGGKRNEALRAARGEIIAHWDDDDWQSDQRLTRQVMPIVRGLADITGLSDILFLVLHAAEFWAVTRALFRRLFVENVSGGTLVFRREVFLRSGPYPATSLREDADFMVNAMRDGARLCRVPGRDLYVYVRHDGNTWKFKEGRYLQQSGWSQVPEPDFIGPDREFYRAPAALTPPSPRSARPLVSCIMPTADRRAFVAQAIRHFVAQDYPERELIVLDDGGEGVEDLIPRLDNVRYRRLDRRVSLGEKRNLACEMARGALIAHWDDDDWMSPQWLSSQVRTLRAEGADVCGLNKVFFYAPESRQAWRYVYDGARPWVCGGTLCYTRQLWERVRFPNVDVGEDNAMVWSPHPKRLAVNPHTDLYIATIHPRNTSPKLVSSARWHSFSAARLEQLMRATNAT
ncbi:glycosyltransferase [Nannocystis punicea]|uniref:Glycosyltransferase n=1 Tax=Nannocystis punicea TaxID=2995304 RepID=A0ABY7H973_9BACT|nr:glycosyltransferase [Nannocystis poenicansa]WAS95657.1 glycosyltransferase [Nannocystis poenicansa]